MLITLPDCGKLLVLSDIHVGDPRLCTCTLQLIWKRVHAEAPSVLVLAGDVLEACLPNGEQIALIKSICGLSEQVIILEGNHDTDCTLELARSVHATFCDSVTGTNGGASFAIEHGHRFDTVWHRRSWLGHVTIWLNRMIYKVLGVDVQQWLREFKCVEKKLLKQHDLAQEAWKGKDIVITGHTHLPTNDPSGTGYFNSGDWLYHTTYVVVDNGSAALKSAQE